MTYTRDGDKVTLEMTLDDYNGLLMILGYSTGESLREDDKAGARWKLDFINRLNRTNPQFRAYRLDPISVDKNPKLTENKLHRVSDFI
jgi:hypothetical protein